MRVCLIGISVILGIFGLLSCGGMGTAPIMGDIQAGDDPAEGGIAEVPNPSRAMANKSGKSLEQLQRGHEIYMLRCGECHVYQLPQDLDIEDWEDAMPQMIRHAGLASADERAVLDYVIAVRSERGQ
jgi:cytochrome c5